MTTWEPGASEVFTHGLAFEAALHGIARQQTGAEHDAGVRGVGAAGDGGDHDVAMADAVVGAGDRDALVAIADGEAVLQRDVELRGGARQRHAVLRALRPGEAGLDGGDVELERVA